MLPKTIGSTPTAGEGWVSGVDNRGTFSGGSSMIRAEAATVLCKADDYATGTQPPATTITIDQAKRLVMDKVPGLTADNVWIRQEFDDGRWVYKGEAYHNNLEYEFEISANNVTILNWDIGSRWD